MQAGIARRTQKFWHRLPRRAAVVTALPAALRRITGLAWLWTTTDSNGSGQRQASTSGGAADIRGCSLGCVPHRAAASRADRSATLVQPEPIRTATTRAANAVGARVPLPRAAVSHRFLTD